MFLMLMKTMKSKILESDYIMFVRPTVYVNVRLLELFVQKLNFADRRIYCGRIYSPKYSIGPYSYCYYGGLDALLLKSSEYYDVLTKARYRTNALKIDQVVSSDFYKEYKTKVADNAIGFIIDSFLAINGRNYKLYYQDWGMRHFSELDESDWYGQITIEVKKYGYKCGHFFEKYRYIHEVIEQAYIDSGQVVDYTWISDYFYNVKKTITRINEYDNDTINKDTVSYTEEEYEELRKKEQEASSKCKAGKIVEKVFVSNIEGYTAVPSPTTSSVEGGWVYAIDTSCGTCPCKPSDSSDGHNPIIPPIDEDDDPTGDKEKEYHTDLDTMTSNDPNHWAYDQDRDGVPDLIQWEVI